MDEQHQRWIAVINDVEEAILSGRTASQIEPALEAMVQYTLHHFSEEEALLERLSYPELGRHRTLHGVFREHVRKLREALDKDEMELGTKVMNVLQDWLVDHILVEDRKYARFALQDPDRALAEAR